jgi:antirestriction protein ArdC
MSTLPDLYASVTERIVAALEAGTPPWICPWHGGSVDPRPANVTTARPYRGINVLLLNLRAMSSGYNLNRWLTFQQAQAVGGHVRRGEQGTQIVFFKMHEVDKGSAVEAEADRDRRVIPLLRSFTVFNVAQVDDLPETLAEPVPEPGSWEPLEETDNILALSGADIRHGGTRACYVPDADLIQLPPAAAFDNAGDYYATALHELTHWTGHPTRCDRPLGRRHGLDAYAFEELVAEMGSAFLTNYCGIEGRMQHASYIACWLQALRCDKRLIFTAASQAQKSADYLLPKPTEIEPAAQASADALAA